MGIFLETQEVMRLYRADALPGERWMTIATIRGKECAVIGGIERRVPMVVMILDEPGAAYRKAFAISQDASLGDGAMEAAMADLDGREIEIGIEELAECA